MADGTPDQPATEPTARCLDLETMDRIVSDPVFEPGPDVGLHLDWCERCRDQLAEIRRANQFLERFRTGAGETAAPAAPDANLAQIPGYNMLGLLSFGGQGAVYRAVQQRTSREVAIKVPIGNAQRRPSARYRFEREIELTARLDHPGIVRVLGACELSDGRLGCVMEFVRGVPFDQWAAEKRSKGSLRDIVVAAGAVADAIAYAHQRAIIHRDIKPSNVIVTYEGTPRVLDFGLAKAIDDSGSSFATLTGTFLGTLLYSAPEQISKGVGTIDLRTDVYTLGLLLFQALTGRLPYDAEASPAELVQRIQDFPPTRPSSLSPEIGSELDAVVMMAMAREPERRYQSVADFRDDLRAWLDGRAVRARTDSRWYTLRKSAWQHRRVVAITGIVVVALVAILIAGLITREQIARADLADAVRDARMLESYWVRMADLRSVGQDNFEAGEFGVWDALLEPEPLIVRNGIDVPIGEERTLSGAAYWALWEIYLDTPVTFSVPTLDRSLSAYDSRLDAIVIASESSGALQWWDWRNGRITHSVSIRTSSGITSFLLSPDARTAILTCSDGGSFFVDVQARSCTRFDPRVVTMGTRITNDRVLTSVLAENTQIELRLWDSQIRPPSLIARIPTDYPESADVDASGSVLLALSRNGDLSAFDMRTGEVILRRSGEVQPRFLKVQTRGNPGEFLLFGSGSSVFALNLHDRMRQFVPMAEKGTFADGAREIASAIDSERIIAVSDRYRLEIGSNAESTTGPVLPALSATGIALSPDGVVAFGMALPSRRSIAVGLESDSVRRIPFPAEVTESGFATVTCVRFSDDSATLFAAGMDGSVRGFDTRSGAERWRAGHDLGNGIEIMRPVGDSVYVGTHDLGRGNATVLRFLDGSAEQMHPADERRFSGLEVGPDGRTWGLTGDGHLILIAAEKGAPTRDVYLERHPDNRTFRSLARIERHGLLVAGPAEKGVVLLDEDTLEPLGGAAMPPIREIVVSPTDPDLFATAGDDGRIRLWRLRSGSVWSAELVREMGAHAGSIFCLAFSPDGNRIASGGGAPEQRDVRIWDVDVPAGSIEVVEQSLTRWPACGAQAEGAEILVGEEALPTRQIGNGQYRTQLSANPHFPFVVKVRFSDGKISDPIIVHDETALRIASPGVTDRRLRNAFDRILRGEEDIIDLAFQAHLIFETGHSSGSQAGRATRSGEPPKKEREAKDYLTSEEFRDAVSMKPATGESGRFSIDDPGLLDLLAIIFRGVTDVGGREARRRQDQEEDADLQAGEKEDGDELTDDEPLNPAATPPSELEPVQRTFSQAQIDRRKSQLKKAIGGFEKMLENLSAEPSTVSSRLTAQTAFILNLMVFACTKDHHRTEGAPVRLMALAPSSNSDRELAFAVRAGRILQSIWVGGRTGPLIDRLGLDHRQNPIPDDLFFFIIISRWAIARACLSAMDGVGNDHLGKILQAMAVKIYQASSTYGPLDEEAEYGFIAKLDGSLGFSETETRKLIGDCRRFAATVSGGIMPSSAKAVS